MRAVRLAADTSEAAASADANRVFEDLAKAYPKEHASVRSVKLVRASDFIEGRVRMLLIYVFAAACALFLIACINIAGLQLSRAIQLTGDMNIRIALGANGKNILAQPPPKERFWPCSEALAASESVSYC